MNAKKQKNIGRTPWDLLNELIHNQRAVLWAAVVSWLLIAGAVAALWTGYATVQFSWSSPPINDKPPNCEDYEISISSPPRGEFVTPPFIVSGYSKPLPKEFEPWLFTTLKPGSPEAYWPIAPSEVRDQQWRVSVSPGNWEQGEIKHYAVFIVGENGKKLIQYYKAVMKAMSKPGSDWMPLTVTTPDMVKCVDVYPVKLK